MIAQYVVLVGLTINVTLAGCAAVDPPKKTIWMTPTRMRRAALVALTVAVGEWSLLWSAGFFQGVW